ncbi:MAG: SURF1 family protein [Nitrosomonas sp.]|uniref:SURF1 family protein n=1 Tax=Nitrosomonas sp. TaxID=42353 RepID=UPI00271573C4|nr:SURF1 family protein [Nitrosomonas sp.]MDO9471396.1 SURF1 family protein [Nitrosomonas sp.]MDP1787617.1 SURF1 family protein [Nitrosomonas sp.]MDP2225336.1 SURF1 family protein [Nitrosomonas sp.]
MIVLGYRFEPKLWAVFVTALFVIIFIELGKWQLSRADEKNARHELLELYAKQPAVTLPNTLVRLEDFQYREVEVQGEFISEHTIYLDNKTHQGRAGYHVITPLKVLNSELLVVINRGWIATGNDRSVLPYVSEIDGVVKISGLVVAPELRTLNLSEMVTAGKVWDNFNLQRYQEVTRKVIQPLMVLQRNHMEDSLIRDWDRPGSGADKNLGYAVQWFLLAATAIIIFIVLNVKRKNSKSE